MSCRKSSKRVVDAHPSQLLSLAALCKDLPGTCLYYSGGSFDSAKSSLLFLFPTATVTIHAATGSSWQDLQNQLTLDPNDPFPLWNGYVGYGMGSYADPDKTTPHFPSETPDAYFQKSALLLIADHSKGQVTLITDEEGRKELPPSSQALLDQIVDVKQWTQKVPLKGIPPSVTLKECSDDIDTYCRKVALALKGIYEGECYQVNLSQQFLFTGRCDPFDLFYNLCHRNPAPFSVFMNLGTFTIVSTSPERLLMKNGNVLETRPIKGTVPRGRTLLEDVTQKEKLLESLKERAELMMIIDLMRNDLSRISLTGSLKIVEMLRCEAYTNVFHLLSVIRSIAQDNKHPLSMLQACFPGGSITGCPKLRAMEFIAELEQRPRGIYTGSIGYLTGHGDFDFNIAIRTLTFHDHQINLQLGGAIVADSIPEKEFLETMHKGASLFEYLNVRLL